VKAVVGIVKSLSLLMQMVVVMNAVQEFHVLNVESVLVNVRNEK
jgi:hypothetical protein